MGGKGGTAHRGGVNGSGTPGVEDARGAADSRTREEPGDEGEGADEDGWKLVESTLKHRLTWVGEPTADPVDASTIAHFANTRFKPCG
jgi:hypothetical protein